MIVPRYTRPSHASDFSLFYTHFPHTTRLEITGATRGVTVSTSAFLACHQCYCAGLSLAWGLTLRAVVCGIFRSPSPEVFSGYSGFLPSFFDRLVGLVARRPPRERKIPGSNPACAGIFSGSSHTSDLKNGTPVATLPGAWRYRVSTVTGRPGVSIL